MKYRSEDRYFVACAGVSLSTEHGDGAGLMLAGPPAPLLRENEQQGRVKMLLSLRSDGEG